MVKAEGKVKVDTGGDLNSKCSKIQPVATFNSSKYLPDGRVYVGVPTTSAPLLHELRTGPSQCGSLW